ncbi:CDGSH iron-sulfur domain-containing protein 3, mitochondrial [Copidosoma floridanum]|uniref:CDGSH iron-sulfur domain-containing protein 3, mitochondrial n=1 Tax=Copidosoma floridanum TaxID=29053 RepID=UPI0006C9DB7F|nr:CDGSH iron-sulfur domain-containing protein 3, mitochondrial [Copidosoma floridanum]
MNSNFLMGRLSYISRVPSMTKYQTPKRLFSSKLKENDDAEEIPVNPLKTVYTASHQKGDGKFYDKKPFKITCEEGKVYHWCLCGHSKNQPFCDGTHNNVFLKIKHKPVKFTVTKTKEYYLCNCKRTQNRPFCDGTHKKPEIQEMRKY